MNRRTLVCALGLLPVALAGCGSSTSTERTTTTLTATTSAASMTLTVFRVEDGKLVAHAVQVPPTQATAAASLRALGIDGSVTISNGTATVDLPGATDDQIEEIVFTLTQYPSIQRVSIGGKTYTRDDFSTQLQPIVIESPATGAAVAKTFHVSGSASVFEATLVVELVQGGKVVVKQTVTAGEGAPGRGPFDTVVTAPAAGATTVVAFAPSAEDGSPQHEVRAPVTVTP